MPEPLSDKGGWPQDLSVHPEAARRLAAVLGAADAALPGPDVLDRGFLAAVHGRIAAMVGGHPLPPVHPAPGLEAAVLAYGEQLALDPHGVTDAHVDALNAHLSPGEVVALTVDLGMADASERLRLLLETVTAR